MNMELMNRPVSIATEPQTTMSTLATKETPSIPLERTEQPTTEVKPATPAIYGPGSLVRIVSVARPFLERQPVKFKASGRQKVKPGRAPGGDLSGADLLGAVGTIIRPAVATLSSVSNNPDPLVLVRLDDEELYLQQSEIAPFESEPTRD